MLSDSRVLKMNKAVVHCRSKFPGEIRDFYFINQVRSGRASVPDVNGVSAGLGVCTSVKDLRIVWKSNLKRNSVDLEFAGLAKNPDKFNDIIKKVGATNYEPAVTTGSMSLTVKFPGSENVSFNRPFSEQIENIRKFLDVAVEFDNLANKIFYENITDLTK